MKSAANPFRDDYFGNFLRQKPEREFRVSQNVCGVDEMMLSSTCPKSLDSPIFDGVIVRERRILMQKWADYCDEIKGQESLM